MSLLLLLNSSSPTKTLIHTIDISVLQTESKTSTVDVSIVLTSRPQHTIDTLIVSRQSKTHTIDGLIQKTQSLTHSFDAFIGTPQFLTYTIDALIKKTQSKSETVDISIVNRRTKTETLDVSIISRSTKTYSLDIYRFKITAKTHNIDAYLSITRIWAQHNISVLIVRTTNVLLKAIDILLVADPATDPTTNGDLTSALAEFGIHPTAKALKITPQNKYFTTTPTINFNGDVANSLASAPDSSIINGYDIPSMKFAFADSDATTNAGYRIFPETSMPDADNFGDVPKIPWVSERKSSTSGLFSPAIVVNIVTGADVFSYVGNKIFIVTDAFGKGNAGIITDCNVRIRQVLAGSWTTIATGISGFTGYDPSRIELFLQSGGTWSQTRPDILEAPITIAEIEVTINNISINLAEQTAFRVRSLLLYEIGAEVETDLTGYIDSFTVNEHRDISNQTISPVGTSAANTLNLRLVDYDTFSGQSFNPLILPYPDYAVREKGSRIHLWLGFQLLDLTTTYLPWGVWYIDEWNISADLSTIDISARDFSKFLQENTMAPMFYQDYTLTEVITDIVEQGGVRSYQIDASLLGKNELATGITQDFIASEELVDVRKSNMVWTQGQSYWEFLQTLAYADLGMFYFDRNNKFIYQTKETIQSDSVFGFNTYTVDEDIDLINFGPKFDLNKNYIKLHYEIPTLSDKPESLWDSTELITLSSTSLSADVTATVLDIPVGDISDWPKQGYFKIEDEIIKYNDRDDITFKDCTRGWLDTIAVAHAEITTSSNWSFSGGTWVVTGGVLQATGQGGTWGTAHLIDNVPGRKYNVTGKFKITASPYKCGIIIKWGTANKYYKFVIKSIAVAGSLGVTGSDLDSLYEIYSVDTGVDSLLKASTNPAKKVVTDIEYAFKVQVDNDELALFINGTRVLTYKVEDTDLSVDFPASVGFAARGAGPTIFDNLIITTLPDSQNPGTILVDDGFGLPIYEIRKFDIEYSIQPATGIQYYITNTDEIEMISFKPNPFVAKAYILNKKDGLSIVSGTPPGSDTLPEFFFVTGYGVAQAEGIFEFYDFGSINTFGRRDFEVDLPWVQSPTHAKFLSKYLVDSYKNPQLMVTAEVIANPLIKLGDIILVDSIQALGTGSTTKLTFKVTGVEITLSGGDFTQNISIISLP